MTNLWKALIVFCGLIAVASPAVAKSSDCGRPCLGAKLDQFLKAVVAKDPSTANLFVGFRETQNAVVTPAGEGIWKTNSGIGTLDRRFFDPATGGAEFYGTMREGDKLAIASLRLKVERGQVAEAEWHIARAGDPNITGDTSKSVFDVDNLLNNPPEQRTVPVGNRASREALVAAVNSYFDGATLGTGRYVQANPGCIRYENGTGVPISFRNVRPADADFQTKVDCRSGYGGLNIVNVAARRYLMVDEEAQAVVASAVFMREPTSPKRRNCFMEIFFMDGGKISRVYAAMVYADPKLPVPNWPPYDGNFPIAAPVVPSP